MAIAISPPKRDREISMAFSKILRHDGKDVVGEDGFALVRDVLSLGRLRSLACTSEDVRRIVRDNDKQRFSLEIRGGQEYIRANQGHTLATVHVAMEEITIDNLPSAVIHGTYLDVWESIRTQGLRRMNRQHIHMAAGLFEEVKSGMRRDCTVAIYVKIREAIQDGIQFSISSNDVILSAGIDGVLPPKYFEKAIQLPSMKELSLTSEYYAVSSGSSSKLGKSRRSYPSASNSSSKQPDFSSSPDKAHLQTPSQTLSSLRKRNSLGPPSCSTGCLQKSPAETQQEPSDEIPVQTDSIEGDKTSGIPSSEDKSRENSSSDSVQLPVSLLSNDALPVSVVPQLSNNLPDSIDNGSMPPDSSAPDDSACAPPLHNMKPEPDADTLKAKGRGLGQEKTSSRKQRKTSRVQHGSSNANTKKSCP
mmetsp:Transcript_17446/g.28643  ORF Transcript_17446/g.28643 Transcript_17446/m.28643 type:complete len:419 (-) Transcript_17446:583-1839(-)